MKQVIYFVVGAGVLLALLRIFNYDPFGIVEWIFSWFEYIINKIANFLTGNDTFVKFTKKPS